MPGYFWMRFNSVGPSYPGAIAFDLTVEHNTRRTARICSAEFELWLVDDPGRNLGRLLARLAPDIRGDAGAAAERFVVEFKESQKSPCRLLWHYTPEQLQQVEDARAGGNALFHLYARFTVQAVWPQRGEPAAVTHEVDTPGHEGGGWPLRVEIAESEWIALLARVGFRHPVMDRVPWPALPPQFCRAERHLNDAWNYYRQNDPPGALASCHKAFECLGFDLFGDEVKRKDVLDLLMDGGEPEKQEKILALLRALQGFFHLGRHDKRAPIPLTEHDAQMAVLCTTTLLAYLAPQQSLRGRSASTIR